MRFDVITLFPEMFTAVSASGITSRALEQGLFSLYCWNLREFATGERRNVDDRPYGGGPGMVMTPLPLVTAIRHVRTLAAQEGGVRPPVVYLSPQGERLTQERVFSLSHLAGMVLVCGRYEGVDQRVLDSSVDIELSLGDFVLSGGELAAMCLIDALARQLPGVVGDPQGVVEESFTEVIFDCPHYTRPPEFEGMSVPAVLQQGDHAAISRWRRQAALGNTAKRRPDLIAKARALQKLSAEDEAFLASLGLSN